MAADDAYARGAAVGYTKPRKYVLGRLCDRALVLELERAVRAAEAQTREAIRDEAQTIEAGQRIGPAARLIAVHVTKELGARRIIAKRGLQLAGASAREGQIPLRRQPRMQHRVAQALIVMQHGARAQPREQLVSIRRAEHIVDRILRFALGACVGGGE